MKYEVGREYSKSVIRASEIGEYGYCSRAWWYRHVMKVPLPDAEGSHSRLAAGTRAHARHGRAVALAQTLKALGIAMATIGFVILLIAALFFR